MKQLSVLLRHRYFLFIVGSIGLVLSLLLLNPTDQSFIVLLIPILFFWLVVFSLVWIFLERLKKGSPRWLVVAFIVATASTMLAMFSAIDTVSWYDLLLLVSLTVVGTFYFNRTWPK